ncbi:CPC_1213 family protein [Clostridium tyrobutyricum]|jgi:hypothetical protein|uniref:CPC_1213 family protein n=1 Tax=Clostridium tyrobutyricum TaxID=1519 RepID=UPI001C385A4E|nr:CPC_1213 family protein [Clostridium tyrobutyricum]MBV4438312.1 hypothetical protein [Clostridium tyrobutyricum]MBV4440566.1 hypothetical protein [Clostridium tyrobutyricum]
MKHKINHNNVKKENGKFKKKHINHDPQAESSRTESDSTTDRSYTSYENYNIE